MFIDNNEYLESDCKKYLSTNPGVLDEKIACKCGENKMFSAEIKGWAVFLICNKCKNKFQIYSG